MTKPVLNPLRKLFVVLALLTACMASLSSFTAKEAHALICCSACDVNPNSPACHHGCSPSC
jgi:hypothetical protein